LRAELATDVQKFAGEIGERNRHRSLSLPSLSRRDRYPG
jgi:hypothetical protein